MEGGQGIGKGQGDIKTKISKHSLSFEVRPPLIISGLIPAKIAEHFLKSARFLLWETKVFRSMVFIQCSFGEFLVSLFRGVGGGGPGCLPWKGWFEEKPLKLEKIFTHIYFTAPGLFSPKVGRQFVVLKIAILARPTSSVRTEPD